MIVSTSDVKKPAGLSGRASASVDLGLPGPALNQAGPGPGWGLNGRPGLNIIENIWIIGFNQFLGY